MVIVITLPSSQRNTLRWNTAPGRVPGERAQCAMADEETGITHSWQNGDNDIRDFYYKPALFLLKPFLSRSKMARERRGDTTNY